MKILKLLPLLLLYLAPGCKTGIDNPEITEKELKEHLSYLASEELQGRSPGTEGGKLAAEYIREQFEAFGLTMMAEEGFQPFEMLLDLSMGDGNQLSAAGREAVAGKDFIPMPFSGNEMFTAGLVFAGYGFDFSKGEVKWNDYEELSVNGKWVLLLSGDPEEGNPGSIYAEYSSDILKGILAREKGAGGVIFVENEAGNPDDQLKLQDEIVEPIGIPAIKVTREWANIMLEGTGDTIMGLSEEILSKKESHSFEIPLEISASIDLVKEKRSVQNVVAMIEGTDPLHASEYIVIGGHFDHLGLGGEGSGSRKPDTLAVHYGADDNASGVSAVIEIAEKMAANRENLKRNVIFMAFDAEEKGLLGSKYFINNPPVELSNITAMINLDMVGRLKETNSLQVGGVGTSLEGDSLLKSIAGDRGLELATSPEGYGPSDHAAFYGHDIPVFFFSTGPHLEYHTPMDAEETINYPGMKSIADLVHDLAIQLDQQDNRLTFQEAGPKTSSGFSRRRGGVTLGIMPDFAGVTKEGLRADFVLKDRPAYMGGMKDGDIITAINGLEVKNINDYMFRLSQLKPGETIHVDVIREDEKVLLLIQL